MSSTYCIHAIYQILIGRDFMIRHISMEIKPTVLCSHLQEPHQKRIRENEFLLAESEFNVDVFVVVV